MRQPTRIVTLAATFVLAAGFVAAAALGAGTAAPAAHETVAEVPALGQFHEVIYEIWHGAWPSKDTAKLIELLPQVKTGVSAVAAAELPGILREKKPAWEAGVKKLQEIAAAYESAAAAKDGPKLLDAAEALHMQYERLVRVVRPAVKELEEFHTSLYVLYHYELPAYSLEKITARAADLESKMTALSAAKLSERQKPKQEAFDASRKALAESVAALKAACATMEEPKVKAAVETVHSSYEALAKIFE